MDNNDTIRQLSEALNTLISKYEVISDENNKLKDDIKSLQGDREKLQDEISKGDDASKEQNVNIDSMLGKIEALFDSKTGVKKESSYNPKRDLNANEKKDSLYNSNEFNNTEKSAKKEGISSKNLYKTNLTNSLNETKEDKDKSSLDILSSTSNTVKNEDKKTDKEKDADRIASLLNGL